jgi:hypothetical protein
MRSRTVKLAGCALARQTVAAAELGAALPDRQADRLLSSRLVVDPGR